MNFSRFELLAAVGAAGALYYAYTTLQKKRVKQPFPEAMICSVTDDCDIFHTCVPSTQIPEKKVCSGIKGIVAKCDPKNNEKYGGPGQPVGPCGANGTCSNDGLCVPRPKLFGCKVRGCDDPFEVCVNGECVKGTCEQLNAAGKGVKCGSGLGCQNIKSGQQYFPVAGSIQMKTAATDGVVCAFTASSKCAPGQIYTQLGNSSLTKACSQNSIKYGKWYFASIDSTTSPSLEPTRGSPLSSDLFYADVNTGNPLKTACGAVPIMGFKYTSGTPIASGVLFAIYPSSAASSNSNSGIGTSVKYEDSVAIAVAHGNLRNALGGKVVNVSDLNSSYPQSGLQWSWIGARTCTSGGAIWIGPPSAKGIAPPSPGIFRIQQTQTVTNPGKVINIGDQMTFKLSSVLSGAFSPGEVYLSYSPSTSSSAGTFGSGWSYASVFGPMVSSSTFHNIHRFWDA